MIRWDHPLAISFLGVGGLILLWQQHTETGAALLGMLAGYAFKNGLNVQTATASPSSQTAKPATASI